MWMKYIIGCLVAQDMSLTFAQVNIFPATLNSMTFDILLRVTMMAFPM